MSKGELIVPRTWRSEIKALLASIALGLVSAYLSPRLSFAVIDGRLFTIGGTVWYLRLPLLAFLPAMSILGAVYRIYNVRYSIDPKGIESRVGILSLNQTTTRVRFEDVRGVEIDQTLLERFLDIGSVQISTAATYTVEVIMDGVAAPKEIQDMINGERDRRQKGSLRALAERPEEAMNE